MRLRALALALLAGTASPSLAQSATDTLHQALEAMPELILTNPAPTRAVFFDVAAWRAVSNKEVSVDTVKRLSLAPALPPVDVIAQNGLANWDEKAGVAIDDIAYFAGFGEQPTWLTYWGLADEAAASEVYETLAAGEFEPIPGKDGVIGNGEPMAMDFEKRDIENPWRGSAGQASFATTAGNALVQATTPELFNVLSASETSVADNAATLAALDGLQVLAGPEDGKIIQATLISPAFGLSAADPAALMSENPSDFDTLKEKMEAAAAAADEGVPPYFGGIIADVQYADHSAMLISLAYADCAMAETAVATMISRWNANMAETLPGEVTGETVQGDEEMCTAAFSVANPADAEQGNPALVSQMMYYSMRGFNVAQIGTTP